MRSSRGRPRPSRMGCSSRPIGGDITSGPTPPQQDGVFASSNEGRPPIARRPPTSPEASCLRADPSTRPGRGIRRIACCIQLLVGHVSGRGLGLFWGSLVVGGRVGARGGGGHGGGVSWCSCHRSSFVTARIACWILGRGFESHRGGLCWSVLAGDPRSRPRTPTRI